MDAPGARPEGRGELALPVHDLVSFCVKEIVPVAVVAFLNRPVTVLVVTLVKRFPPCFPRERRFDVLDGERAGRARR